MSKTKERSIEIIQPEKQKVKKRERKKNDRVILCEAQVTISNKLPGEIDAAGHSEYLGSKFNLLLDYLFCLFVCLVLFVFLCASK